MTRRRPAVAALLTACVALVALAWLPATARGAVVDPTTDGYMAEVSVHFHGNGVPGGDETKKVLVSPTCWWAPAAGDYTNAQAMLDWYDNVTGGSTADGIIAQYGPRSVWQAAAAAEASGQDLSWYMAYCKDPTDYTKFGIGGTEVGDPVGQGAVTYVTFLYRTFPAGQDPPEARVAPAELARVAYAEMKLPEPVTDRNPRVAGTPGAPTLVDLPTWFWVTNPLAVATKDDPLWVRASINQPDGEVYARVNALVSGVSIGSRQGSHDCTPASALVSYPPNPPGATPCTVVFTHAARSLGITVTTAWEASWTGTDQNVPQGLDPKTQQANQQVAVAEVQNVVTR